MPAPWSVGATPQSGGRANQACVAKSRSRWFSGCVCISAQANSQKSMAEISVIGGVGPRGSYVSSIEEVRRWLSSTNLEEFIYILLDNGYDDLDALSHASDEVTAELMLDLGVISAQELEEMQALFPDKVHRHKLRFMCGHLRNMVSLVLYCRCRVTGVGTRCRA